MRSSAPLVVLVLVSSVSLAGTAVGHPVPTTVAAGSGLVYTQGAVPIATMTVDRCDDTTETFDVDATLDPVDHDTLTLPVGSICGVALHLSDRFLLGGQGSSGGLFALSLGVDTIVIPVDPPIVVPTGGGSGGTALRFAEVDWVTATMLDLDVNEIVVVGATHPLHDTLRDAVELDSAAW